MSEAPSSEGRATETNRETNKEPTNIRDSALLRKLYCTEGKSLKQIASLAGTTKSDVHYWMVKHGIAMREWSAKRPKCEPNKIHALYWNQGMTIRAVAKLIGVSFTTTRKHLLRETALRRSSSGIGHLRSRRSIKYPRLAFSDDEVERAYLLGFRGGDLNAAMTSPNSVMVRVSTTHPAMLDLFAQTFGNYGHCSQVPRRVFLTGYD